MVYVDTNSALEIFFNRRHGKRTENYIVELVKRNGMIVWSQHTIDEITQIIHVSEYNKIAKANNISSWKDAENAATDLESSNHAKTVLTQVDTVTMYLEQFGDKTDVDERSLNLLTRQIYSEQGTNQQDSKHLAIANLTGTNNILTHDAGFLRFQNVNVYGSSYEIVQANQPRQLPASYVDLSERLLLTDSLEDENVS